MEHAKKNTIRVILVIVLGLIACAIKLWISIHPNTAVRYTQEEAGIASTGMSSQETTISISDQSPSASAEATATSTLPISDKQIPIYICGYVMMPGIYETMPGTYLYQLLDMAGGLLPEAADQYINMVLIINEPLSIYIPSEEEVEQITSDEESDVSEYLRNGLDEGVWGIHDTVDESGVSDSNTPEEERRININTATQAELETLPGVGESTALAIIKYREENGNFATAEDIMKVSGIKEGRYEAIKDSIEV